MRLEGSIYDFGDQKISDHLRSIAVELGEQACINGEDDQGLCETQPLYELSSLVAALAGEVESLESVQR